MSKKSDISIESPCECRAGATNFSRQKEASGIAEPPRAAGDRSLEQRLQRSHRERPLHGEGAAVVLAGGEHQLQDGEAGVLGHTRPHSHTLVSPDDGRVGVDPLAKEIVVDDEVAEAGPGGGSAPLDRVDDRGVGPGAENSLVVVEAQVQVAVGAGLGGAERREDQEEEAAEEEDGGGGGGGRR